MGGGDAEGRGAADVLTRQVDGAEVQVGDERNHVLGRGRAVVAQLCGSGVPEAAEVEASTRLALLPPAGGSARPAPAGRWFGRGPCVAVGSANPRRPGS